MNEVRQATGPVATEHPNDRDDEQSRSTPCQTGEVRQRLFACLAGPYAGPNWDDDMKQFPVSYTHLTLPTILRV